ncbi:MAG: thioesterase family protein [Gemmataceae bacterium]
MHPLVQKLLPDYPVVIRQPVDWGDMDAYRHVNNVVYFRYFENVRLEYFERLDWRGFEKETGVGPIVASIQARYRRAVTYPDTLWVGARLSKMEEDRFTLAHRIVSEALEDWTTEGQVVVVTFVYATGKKTPIPDEMRRRIEAVEKRERW